MAGRPMRTIGILLVCAYWTQKLTGLKPQLEAVSPRYFWTELHGSPTLRCRAAFTQARDPSRTGSAMPLN